MPRNYVRTSLSLVVVVILACEGPQGQLGPQGPQGPIGAMGNMGKDGKDGRDGEDATNPDKIGTRLKQYQSVFVADDGTQTTSQTGMYRDTKLSLDCVFQGSEGGRTRCLPTTRSADTVAAEIMPGAEYYSDSLCTRQIAVGKKEDKTCSKSGKYLLVTNYSDWNTCNVASYYKVYSGPPLYTAAPIYRKYMVSGCVSISSTEFTQLMNNYPLYDLWGATYMPAATFVASETKIVLP